MAIGMIRRALPGRPGVWLACRCNPAAGRAAAVAAAWSVAFMYPMLTHAAQAAGGSSSDRRIEEVVVTAQKVSQNVNDIGMSITALSGDQLDELGVVDIGDLEKAVPGFKLSKNALGTPVYTMRGIGFFEATFHASPAVTSYLDEVPIPYTAMTKGMMLDSRRVEVMKGPQGTVFGMNSTGGAINVITNKPTDTFEAGGHGSFGKYNAAEIGGYLSGPVTNTVRYRFAMNYRRRDGWQEDFTGTANHKLGDQNFLNTRLILDWSPTSRLRTTATINWWQDLGETQAPQFFGTNPVRSGAVPPELVDHPVAPNDTEAASWDPLWNYHRRIRMGFGSLRAEYDVAPAMTLTAIAAYERFDRYQPMEGDGTPIMNWRNYTNSSDSTKFYELRLNGSFFGAGNWIVGLNRERDEAESNWYHNFTESSSNPTLGVTMHSAEPRSNENTSTHAAYAHIEYPVLDTVTLQAGVRYTKSERNYNGCALDSNDVPGAGWGEVTEAMRPILFGQPRIPEADVPPGGCATLRSETTERVLPGWFVDNLSEDNWSWKFGVDWNPVPETLLYANVSKGYKSGSHPITAVSLSKQLRPATQESVVAYEIGTKSTLLEGSLQLNGAYFFYRYKDKQLLGAIFDPAFGPLPQLVNVPKSHVYGAEVSAVWQPVAGLRIAPSVSYQESEVDGDFTNFNFLGVQQNFAGASFPHMPDLQAAGDVSYRWDTGFQGWQAFVGGHATFQDNSRSGFSLRSVLNDPSYTLIDLRAGVERGAWRVSAWGRNVTDELYWTNAGLSSDALVRWTGMPRTYGVNLAYEL